MKIKNETYDKMKDVITIWVPAIISATIGLGSLYGFDTELIVGTIGILTVAVGAILKISTNNYNGTNTK